MKAKSFLKALGMYFVLGIPLVSCQDELGFNTLSEANQINSSKFESRVTSESFYVGADLSYANELEDTGVEFKENGVVKDIYSLVKAYGANMIRLRLWHNPTWTNYSTLADVKKSAQRAKSANMSILLDFHYSDTWTDPEQNLVPAAWRFVLFQQALF